jgi:phosphatidylinositol alpha 1,6-mannosyltransferase
MRVAIITESFAPDINGVANSVLRVAEHLAARGHEPLVIAPEPRRSLRGLPIVAVYQTDVPGYTASYHLGPTRQAAWRWIARVHGRAALTLAPSTPTADEPRKHGVRGVHRWGRGVDSVLFHPRHRDEGLRRGCVDLLSDVVNLPRVRVVVVGDGPARRRVARALPSAIFTGTRSGADLARHYASLDVFVHTGPLETCGQTIQEAQASGLPVVAPASGGPLDLVQPGLTGYLVRPGDPADFAAAVTALVDEDWRTSWISGSQRSCARQWRDCPPPPPTCVDHELRVLLHGVSQPQSS